MTPDPVNLIHIIPDKDIKEHLCHPTCKCQPSVEQLPNGEWLVTHNSWDGREFFEASLPAIRPCPTTH